MVRGGNGVDRALQLYGDMNHRYGLARGERIRLRCNFIQGTAGRQDMTTALTLRIIPSAIPALDTLNIEPDLFEAFLPHKGLGLVCGETGSGKSTLLASIYRYCCDTYPDRKVVTYEDPIEYILGCREDLLPPVQSQIGRDVSSYADGLKFALRRAPSLIGIGETRDLPTLSAAIACGQSGHLCLSTMHTHSPGETIPRALLQFPSEVREAAARDLLGVLQYIVVQRLLRTLDGRRQAVREYIIFDDDLRYTLADMDYRRWGHHLDDVLLLEKRRIADQAFTLYQAGRIDRAEMLTVVAPRELTKMEKV